MLRGTLAGISIAAMLAITLVPSWVAADRERARKIETALIGLDTSKARYLTAAERGDAETMIDLCTNDVVIVSPDGVPSQGKDNVGAVWREFFQAGNTIRQELTTNHVDVDGNVAAEAGRYVASLALAGKPKTVATGKYAMVWKREDDTWKCYRLFWTAKVTVEDTPSKP